jgi:hypothetical protein
MYKIFLFANKNIVVFSFTKYLSVNIVVVL